MQRPVVVLPQPDSPTSPSVSPRRIAKLTPSTALTTAGRAAKEAAADLEVLHQIAHLEDHLAAHAGQRRSAEARSPTQHAHRCSAPTASSGGASARHRSTAKGQRGAKAHPPGSRVRSGG